MEALGVHSVLLVLVGCVVLVCAVIFVMVYVRVRKMRRMLRCDNPECSCHKDDK